MMMMMMFQPEQQPAPHKWGDEVGSSSKFCNIASLFSIIVIIIFSLSEINKTTTKNPQKSDHAIAGFKHQLQRPQTHCACGKHTVLSKVTIVVMMIVMINKIIITLLDVISIQIISNFPPESGPFSKIYRRSVITLIVIQIVIVIRMNRAHMITII